jgi:serine/threonine protein kinase
MEGGGQIFKGKYMGNEIAAKQVFSNMMKEDDRAEFDVEVATLTKLSHPCIMACYGLCQEDGLLFMVLEYCGGGDLDAFYRSPAFTKMEFNRVVGELLSGISYIHARSIAHRDLKPANVRSFIRFYYNCIHVLIVNGWRVLVCFDHEYHVSTR